MVFRKTIKEIIVLLGASVVLALIVNFISPEGIALVGQWDTAKGIVTANTKGTGDSAFSEIHQVEVAKKIFDTECHLVSCTVMPEEISMDIAGKAGRI